MATYYIDLYNGSDSSNGTSWANAWKTFTSGATAARIAAGDTIRVCKTPDPTPLGDGSWTNGPLPAAVSITSSTNTAPIRIIKAGHGLTTGQKVRITGHTTNTYANGFWRITNLDSSAFSLYDSTGNGAGGASGTYQVFDARIVDLATNPVQRITDCDTSAWTRYGTADCTCTMDTAVNYGYFGGCSKIVLGAGAGIEPVAYYTLPAPLDLSSYQQISYFINPTVFFLNGEFKLHLCSDTTGTVVVNSFDIGPNAQANNWMPVRTDNTSALGSSIQSLRLDQAADKGAMTIYLQNIIACKAPSSDDSLSLQSLISKGGDASNNAEGWWPLYAIKNGMCMLGIPNGTYWGDSTLTATYKREAYQTIPLNWGGQNQHTATKAGTANARITYSGGWSKDTTQQNGDTFMDGLDNQGVCFQSGHAYVTFENFSGCRFGGAVRFEGSPSLEFYGHTLTNFSSRGYNTQGLFFKTGVKYLMNLGGGALGVEMPGGLHIGDYAIENLLNCNGYGIYSANHGEANFHIKRCFNNAIGFYFTGYPCEVRVYNCETRYNASYGIRIDTAHRFKCFSCTQGDTWSLNNLNNDIRIYSERHNNTDNNHIIYSDYITCTYQTTTKYTDYAWDMAISNAARSVSYPFRLKICRVAVTSTGTLTVSVWVKKSHATNVAAKLIIPKGQVPGLTADVVATKANDTDWEQLSVSCTPTAIGNVEVEVWGWYVAGTGNIYVDHTITAVQA